MRSMLDHVVTVSINNHLHLNPGRLYAFTRWQSFPLYCYVMREFFSSRAADRSRVIPGDFKNKLTITTLAGQNTRPAAITQGVELLPFLGGRESSTLVREWPPLPPQEGSVHACGSTQECLALRCAPTGPPAAPRPQFHHKWIQRYRSFSSLSKHDLLFTSRTALDSLTMMIWVDFRHKLAVFFLHLLCTCCNHFTPALIRL